MSFNPKKMAFGRHETFALRYSWLTKGYQALEKDAEIFTSEDATVRLGVGKNMVASIRYWLRACQIIEPETSVPTPVGKALFNPETGFDPYLEDEATIWLLHWLLVNNSNLATSWFWFFNRFHKPEFTGPEVAAALKDFVMDVVVEGKKPAQNTLKADAQLLHRMYTQSKATARRPIEEALDSPFSILRLMTATAAGRGFISRAETRANLPIEVLAFAVVQVMAERQTNMLPIEDLMYAKDQYSAPGAVFRLTENSLLTKLEELVREWPDHFEIRDTSGIHQLYKLDDELDDLGCLDTYYNYSEGALKDES